MRNFAEAVSPRDLNRSSSELIQCNIESIQHFFGLSRFISLFILSPSFLRHHLHCLAPPPFSLPITTISTIATASPPSPPSIAAGATRRFTIWYVALSPSSFFVKFYLILCDVPPPLSDYMQYIKNGDAPFSNGTTNLQTVMNRFSPL